MPNKEKIPEFDSGENEWTKTIKEQVKELTSLTYKLVFLSKMRRQTTVRFILGWHTSQE